LLCYDIPTMTIRLVVALISVLGAIGLVSVFSRSTQNSGADHVEKKTDDDKKNATSLAPAIPQSDTPNKTQNPSSGVTREDDNQRTVVGIGGKVKVDTIKDRWDKALVYFTGAIVLVGIFQIIFLWRTVLATRDNAEAAFQGSEAAKANARAVEAQNATLKETLAAIQRQADNMDRQEKKLAESVAIARDTAVATKESADALKIAERAWMLAEIDDSALRQPRPTPAPTSITPAQESLITRIVCNIKNHGRTTALMDSIATRMEVIEYDAELPDEPNYVETDEQRWPNGVALPPSGFIQRMSYLTPINLQSVEQNANKVYIYGRILYRDTYGKAHETRFCYRFRARWREADPDTAGFDIDGPPAYNKAT